MRFYYPRSFPRLLFVGFALIALPPVFALLSSAIAVDQLANRSQQAVYGAVQATQISRRLSGLITAMERSARQMVILGDRAMLDNYELNRERLLAAAGEFAALPFDTEQRAALDAILAGEAAIHAALADPAAPAARLQKAVAGFAELAARAQDITRRSDELIDREVGNMRATAAQAQRVTLWQLAALVPVISFLVIGFAILIARPIRQIDAAIRRLGGGDLGAPVEVGGPEDLQYLGERLEWMRKQLLDLEQQKNRFLRQVSHELKTPLTALREGAELLSEEAVGKLTPEQREIAEILRHNSIELQKLIEDLLSYGASQFHRAAPDLKPVPVRRVIERVADDQKLALRAKGLRLAVDAEDVVVPADFDKLRVMLDNLISNAVKFSPRGGTIAVSARADGPRLVIEVADEGPGIDPADRARVFEPFYQGRSAGASRVQGTGIGLSVVREFALAHGGGVQVVDGGPGARLRLTLPLAAGKPA
jgi:two-component system sensor histidine kinase GlrK